MWLWLPCQFSVILQSGRCHTDHKKKLRGLPMSRNELAQWHIPK